MGASFDSASSQYLLNAATPVTAAPFTVAAWVYPTLSGGSLHTVWSAAASANATNYWQLQQLDTDVWAFTASTASGAISATAGSIVDHEWYFVVGREISATNHRVDALRASTGTVSSGQNTTSRAPTVTRSSIGCRPSSTPTVFWAGLIAEWWIANIDIQAGGAAINADFMRALAYGGPFSFPHIAPNVLEYRSFRQSLDSTQDKLGEQYWYGSKDRQAWVNTAGVTLGPHPPLPYWYHRPIGGFKTVVV